MNLVILFLVLLALPARCFAEAEEAEKPRPTSAMEEGHDDHQDGDKHGKDEDHKDAGGHEHGERAEEHGHEEEGGEESEETSSSVGPGKAVTETREDIGFKLSEAATKTLDVSTKQIGGRAPFAVPESAIVRFKDETGVYRLRQGFFKLIEGEAKRGENGILFTPHESADLASGDQIATSGVPLLRVTELDAFSGEASGHAH